MLFLIIQTHTPENCPKDIGGPRILFDDRAPGIKIRGMYVAAPQHTVYYVLEADSVEAVGKFLDPGRRRCTAEVIPVSEETVRG